MKSKINFLVIGSGIAGMSTALLLAKKGKVLLLGKKNLLSGSTSLAQGGIAISRGKDQKSHEQETLEAGSFQNKKEIVKMVIQSSESALLFLQNQGVKFHEKKHREGGHSTHRIWNMGDESGHHIAKTLGGNIEKNPHITFWDHTTAQKLLKNSSGKIEGVQTKNGEIIEAHHTILATGGIGQLFLKTTNPSDLTGDGIAMAHRQGAKILNMEFIQFHPTVLKKEKSPLFLLSEALRGEGAQIVNAEGEKICDPLMTRDHLAQFLFLRETREKENFLDLRHQKNEYWQQHFPTIFHHLQKHHLSPEKNLIPITPAAHFLCGGIATNKNGETSLPGLSAVGEVTYTGMHGANRLASNSLLESLVFAQNIARHQKKQDFVSLLSPLKEKTNPQNSHCKKDIQKICSDFLGIIRTKKGMEQAQEKLNILPLHTSEEENMRQCALLIAKAAQRQKKSIGCHFLQEA